MMIARAILVGVFSLAVAIPPASGQEKPKIRTITAFIRLDAGQYTQQVADTLTMLRNAKARYELAGYEVQSIRISTQPFPEYTRGMSKQAVLAFFHDVDNLAKRENISISIGPALMTEKDDPGQAQILAEILAQTKSLYGSIVVAGSDGVHWKAVRAAADTMKYLEDHTDHSLGNFRFAAIANVPAYTPFYPASYHQGWAINLLSRWSPRTSWPRSWPCSAIRRRAGRRWSPNWECTPAQWKTLPARSIRKPDGPTWVSIFLPAPMKGASIGSATAGFTGGRFGTSGTLSAVATITSALRDIAVKKAGYSGVMMPVLEDTRLAQLWGEGALSMDQLLAYSAVCGTGLDTIPLPGDISTEQLARIIGDVATLSVKLSKPLSARLLPVAGAKAGDQTTFDDPNLVNTVIQPLP